MKITIDTNRIFKTINFSLTGVVLLLILFIAIRPKSIFAQKNNAVTTVAVSQDTSRYKVIFIELGSVRCIPCKEMQLVMTSIKRQYGSQVKIIFHDVWTKEGKTFGDRYKINLIPTQVFLDKYGKEYFRHEGFFAEEELVKVLQQKGVK